MWKEVRGQRRSFGGAGRMELFVRYNSHAKYHGRYATSWCERARYALINGASDGNVVRRLHQWLKTRLPEDTPEETGSFSGLAEESTDQGTF